MVKALIDGRKTQTRRIIKPQPMADGYYHGDLRMERVHHPDGADPDCYARFSADAVGGGAVVEKTIKMPYVIGDRLWVREAHRCNGWATDLATVFYRASEGDGYTAMCEQWPIADHKPLPVSMQWRPSIHMPRWASRLTLIVTDVRVQRLQDINEDDARAEGAKPWTGAYQSYATDFAAIWRAINGPDAWSANPWVVAIIFDVHRGNIDEATT